MRDWSGFDRPSEWLGWRDGIVIGPPHRVDQVQTRGPRFLQDRPPETNRSINMVWYGMVWYGMVWYGMVWYGMVWYSMVWYCMVAFLYTEGIQLTAAHSGGRCSDLTQEEVLYLWRYNLYSQVKYFNKFSSCACWLSVL